MAVYMYFSVCTCAYVPFTTKLYSFNQDILNPLQTNAVTVFEEILHLFSVQQRSFVQTRFLTSEEILHNGINTT